MRLATMLSFQVQWRASGVCGSSLKPFACRSRVKKENKSGVYRKRWSMVMPQDTKPISREAVETISLTE